jgi:hypothetical protein
MSEMTGKVTCGNAGEIRSARAAGFYVIDPDAAVLRACPHGSDREVNGSTDEVGQVRAVIDPLARGRSIAPAAPNGGGGGDRLGPEVERVMECANPLIDQPRIVHGARDQWDLLPGKRRHCFLRRWFIRADRDARRNGEPWAGSVAADFHKWIEPPRAVPGAPATGRSAAGQRHPARFWPLNLMTTAAAVRRAASRARHSAGIRDNST